MREPETLAEFVGSMVQEQRAAVVAVQRADGATGRYIEDVATIYAILTNEINFHGDTVMEWILVAARKALLRAAAQEGIVTWEDVGGQGVEHAGDFPILDRESELKLRADLATRNTEYSTQLQRANALDAALIEERKRHEHEAWGLQQEIDELRNAVTAADRRLADGVHR